ncbi:MAG: hypothetical protein Q9167_005265 [Letrouitia subvulpina]
MSHLINSTIYAYSNYYLRFAISRGDLINAFTEEGKVDRHLPLSSADVESILKKENASSLTAEFTEKQHRFCPARFNFQRPANWNKDVVIPICSKAPINKGGTAHLWQIDVPEEFVEEDLRKESSTSRFNAAPSGSDPDWRYEFALKIFTSKDQKVFENEKSAFISLKGHKGMVKYLTSFRNAEVNTSSNRDNQSTCNILLEFADMDLSVYFRNRLPPTLAKEAEEFWKALFAIATAVKDIHNFKDDRDEGTEYQGWHSDIKPDNILNVDDTGTGICQFKLADPGFARFEPKAKHTDTPKLKLWGGTKTYGPPEYPGESESPVSQAIDIWSLGCVFSLAATWAILGYHGVLQFNEMRKKAIKELHGLRQPQGQADEQDLEGDQFHDGKQLLEIVTHWHKYLRGRLRKYDSISARLLNLVDRKMLITNPDDRIKADELDSQLRKMLGKSCRESKDSVPIEIQVKLKEIDKEVADELESMRHSKATEQGTVNGTTSENQKLAPHAFMLKTTHRQSILSADKVQTQVERQFTNMKAAVGVLGTHVEATPPSSPHPFYGNIDNSTGRHRRVGSDTSKWVPTQFGSSKKSRQHPSQNVFQAREAVTNRDKGKNKLLPKFMKPQPKKDEVLESYFDQRDIKFLVDNAESMRSDWYQATYLLETLVLKAFGQDPDGMDLNFTTGTVKVEQTENSSVFVNKMKHGYPKPGVSTNILDSLGKILNQYLNRLRTSRSRTNDVTLIVLTNGLWAGTTRKEGVKDKIIEFLEELDRLHHSMKHRPFSIEFVQFGNDKDASRRLKDLDNFLRKTGKKNQDTTSKYKDMIDTEHASGDVNKMLLGSFVEAYDEDEEDEPEDDARSLELEDASPVVDDPMGRSPQNSAGGLNSSHADHLTQPPPQFALYSSSQTASGSQLETIGNKLEFG